MWNDPTKSRNEVFLILSPSTRGLLRLKQVHDSRTPNNSAEELVPSEAESDGEKARCWGTTWADWRFTGATSGAIHAQKQKITAHPTLEPYVSRPSDKRRPSWQMFLVGLEFLVAQCLKLLGCCRAPCRELVVDVGGLWLRGPPCHKASGHWEPIRFKNIFGVNKAGTSRSYDQVIPDSPL